MKSTALEKIVGRSDVIHDLRLLIARIAPTEIPVLIQGPTGAGKELVAQAIHELSGRPGPLAALNICAIPDAMFEDELFGHVRGAFTGAVADRPGYLREAHRGTIFFDEIGSLQPQLQGKLLRAVETRQFRPVGARVDVTSEFRVVSASNENLQEQVRSGAFRADLAQRLSGIVINVPPLSARVGDIPALAAHFARQLSPIQTPRLTAGAISQLKSYSWPGNVRELRQVIERAIALSRKPVLDRSQIAQALGLANTERQNSDMAAERRKLVEALEQHEWDTAAVAELLGVHRVTIYRRMQRLGISVPRALRTG